MRAHENPVKETASRNDVDHLSGSSDYSSLLKQKLTTLQRLHLERLHKQKVQ